MMRGYGFEFEKAEDDFVEPKQSWNVFGHEGRKGACTLHEARMRVRVT